MSDLLANVTAWLNRLADGLGWLLLAPLGWMPGWLSATIVSAVTGVLLLAMFKYTSNQKAIKRARDDIKANLLAVKLFKDSASVALRSQTRILGGAMRLMLFSIVPMLVMMVPVCLLLGQLALWYQARPLQLGDQATLTLKLSPSEQADWPDVRLQPMPGVEVVAGPARVKSEGEVCWNLVARENGYQQLRFQVGDQIVEKELAIGNDFMRVSLLRPSWNWSEMAMNPWEKPFHPDSSVQAIGIEYPHRDSWTSGTDWWIGYWFVASMVAAFIFRPWLKVNI